MALGELRKADRFPGVDYPVVGLFEVWGALSDISSPQPALCNIEKLGLLWETALGTSFSTQSSGQVTCRIGTLKPKVLNFRREKFLFVLGPVLPSRCGELVRTFYAS